jgi:hypothetical protein
MISFALCVGSAIWILLPHALVLAFRGEALLAESDHLGTQTVTDAYRSAGIWIEPHLDAGVPSMPAARLCTTRFSSPQRAH